jgi:hypothetical protein
MISAHSPQYTATGDILLVAKFNWLHTEVPFVATPNDTEAHGRELFARATAGEFGPIAAYTAPTVTPIPPVDIQAQIAAIEAQLAALKAQLPPA